jgi:hypothetical protein
MQTATSNNSGAATSSTTAAATSKAAAAAAAKAAKAAAAVKTQIAAFNAAKSKVKKASNEHLAACLLACKADDATIINVFNKVYSNKHKTQTFINARAITYMYTLKAVKAAAANINAAAAATTIEQFLSK